MSLDKAIEHKKEHRKQYRGAKLENRNEYSIKKIARECKDILQEFGISEED